MNGVAFIILRSLLVEVKAETQEIQMLQVRNKLLHLNKSTGAFAIAIKSHFWVHFSFPAVCV